VVELTREMAENDPANSWAATLAEAVARSVAAKGRS
jgi:hypothetical protein